MGKRRVEGRDDDDGITQTVTYHVTLPDENAEQVEQTVAGLQGPIQKALRQLPAGTLEFVDPDVIALRLTNHLNGTIQQPSVFQGICMRYCEKVRDGIQRIDLASFATDLAWHYEAAVTEPQQPNFDTKMTKPRRESSSSANNFAEAAAQVVTAAAQQPMPAAQKEERQEVFEDDDVKGASPELEQKLTEAGQDPSAWIDVERSGIRLFLASITLGKAMKHVKPRSTPEPVATASHASRRSVQPEKELKPRYNRAGGGNRGSRR